MKIRDWFKFVLFSVTPHLVFDEIGYLFSRVDEGLRAKTKNGHNAYIFLACDYANMGDYAITKAQENMLKRMYPDRIVHVIPMKKTYSGIKTILSVGNYDDVVTTIGGGNMNELYYGYERKRNFIVKKLSAYNILAFPQSVAYGENLFGRLAMRRSCLIYSQHANLTFMARDKNAYATMSRLFPNNKVVLAPDVVMTLDLWRNTERKGVVLSMRNDREASHDNVTVERLLADCKKLGLDVRNHDTCYYKEGMSLQSTFDSLIDDYSSAELVVTDRLHGMILAFVTGTPALVLPNNNGKVEAGIEWIRACGYIKIADFSGMNHENDKFSGIIGIRPSRSAFEKLHRTFVYTFLHNFKK